MHEDIALGCDKNVILGNPPSQVATTPARMGFVFETFVMFLVSGLTVTGNILILLVLFRTEQLTHLNKYFFASLTAADLCIGILITPFSIWTSLFDSWIYGETFCHIEAYIAAIFWIASVYSLTWLSIDHYVAVRKPDRYESVMTKTRSVCWVTFIWLAAVCFCCPPLFGVARARYYSEAYICIIDWTQQKAYFITSGLLIIIPPLVALSISNLYIFTDKYKQLKVMYEKCADSNSRPDNYFMNFIVCVVYIVAWSPWCMLQFHESLQGPESSDVANPVKYDTPRPVTAPSRLHFYFMWLAIANSFWKFLLYVILDHDFRIGLKILYSQISCCRQSQHSAA